MQVSVCDFKLVYAQQEPSTRCSLRLSARLTSKVQQLAFVHQTTSQIEVDSISPKSNQIV